MDYIGVLLQEDRYTGVVAVDYDHNEVIEIPKRLDLYNHGPGLSWGYVGSGPAQTALAILAHHGIGDEFAAHIHNRFMREIIAAFPMHACWLLRGAEIDGWLSGIEPLPSDTDERDERA